MKWILEDKFYTFTIRKTGENKFLLKIDFTDGHISDSIFPSYKAARDYLRREYFVSGRMKKV